MDYITVSHPGKPGTYGHISLGVYVSIETATIEPYVVDARPSVGYKRTVYATLAEDKTAFHALEQEYNKED